MSLRNKLRIAVLGSAVPCSRGAPPHLLELAPPGVTVIPYPLPVSAFPYTPFDKLIVDASHAAAGAEAVRAKVDAIYIDTFGDYALAAMRSIGDVPVIGAGEATLQAVSLVARRFSIVTVWPRSLRFIYDDRLAASGLAACCTGIRHVGDESELEHLKGERGAIARMEAADADLTERIVAACRSAVDDDGAEAVVFGCSCMAPVHSAVARALSAPVLCCSRTGFGLVLAAAVGRWAPSPIAYPRVAPHRVNRLQLLLAGAAADPDEPCPVCPSESHG